MFAATQRHTGTQREELKTEINLIKQTIQLYIMPITQPGHVSQFWHAALMDPAAREHA